MRRGRGATKEALDPGVLENDVRLIRCVLAEVLLFRAFWKVIAESIDSRTPFWWCIAVLELILMLEVLGRAKGSRWRMAPSVLRLCCCWCRWVSCEMC